MGSGSRAAPLSTSRATLHEEGEPGTMSWPPPHCAAVPLPCQPGLPRLPLLRPTVSQPSGSGGSSPQISWFLLKSSVSTQVLRDSQTHVAMLLGSPVPISSGRAHLPRPAAILWGLAVLRWPPDLLERAHIHTHTPWCCPICSPSLPPPHSHSCCRS